MALNLVATLRQRPGRALLTVLVVACVAYVIGYPFLVADFPMITDLPFHAACMSIFRHYFDADFGFREQFTLHPFEPYISMYALGALLALVLPIVLAAKLTCIILLSLLPAGLAVLL